MLYETISLGEEARLMCYAPDNDAEMELARVRPAVLICPGGGYAFCSKREAEPVALRLLAAGMDAFVLYYSTGYGVFPKPQRELALAIRHIRQNAARYHAGKLAVMGFSAGAHLACCAGVEWPSNSPWEALGLGFADVRPDGMALCYPVITAGEYAHRGSFAQLTGSPDVEKHSPYSLENLVSDRTPPCFLWHTMDDQSVPVENTLLLLGALRRHGVPAEAHLYPHGVHGLSLANEETSRPGEEERLINPYCQNWMEHAIAWLLQTLK